MGVSRWGGPESREYSAFSMATQPIRQPLTTKRLTYRVLLTFLPSFTFPSFFLLLPLSIHPFHRGNFQSAFHPIVLCILFFLHSFFVSFRFVHVRRGGKGETIPLLSNIVDLTFQAQNSFSHACYTNLCLYMRDSMRIYIGMRESTLILPTTDTTPSARLIRTWRL